MQICQAPTLRLNALNKYNNTHNVHRMDMENFVIPLQFSYYLEHKEHFSHNKQKRKLQQWLTVVEVRKG